MLPGPAYALADRQRGVLARHQLLRWMRRDQIGHRIGDEGELRRLERGCYVLRGAGPRAEHAAFAAALRCRPGATITGPVVLGLLGLDGFRDDPRFEILTAPGRRVRGVRFPHRPDPDPDRPHGSFGEVRTVGPIDALIDSAPRLAAQDPRGLRLAYDQLRWRGLAQAERLRGRVAELLGPNQRAEAVLTLLDLGGLAPESEGERALGRIFGSFEPAPEPQVWVTPRRRVDWYFRPLRFAYEYLGSVDHRGAAQRIDDDARDEQLRDQGIRLGYVTAEDLLDPETLVASVAGRLVVRAHELGVQPPRLHAPAAGPRGPGRVA